MFSDNPFSFESSLIPITDIKDVRQIEIDILLYIKEICELNGIRYYLGYGTLLGAVRHHGFIPWDDDIDVLIPRPDYERFIKAIEKTKNDKFHIFYPGDKNYYYTYIKISDASTVLFEIGCKKIPDMGIFVDVFPLDGMPDDIKAAKKRVRYLYKIRSKISSFGRKRPVLRKNIFKYIHEIYQYNLCKNQNVVDYQNLYLDEISRFNYDSSKYVIVTGGAYGVKSVFLKDWFSNTLQIPFEGYSFPCPKDYDSILHHLYGDYMTLPPEEKRVSRHSFYAYFIR